MDLTSLERETSWASVPEILRWRGPRPVQEPFTAERAEPRSVLRGRAAQEPCGREVALEMDREAVCYLRLSGAIARNALIDWSSSAPSELRTDANEAGDDAVGRR